MSAHHPSSQQPQGTFLPGTKVTVGSHRVVIEKYLSEGGFAHVYVVRAPLSESNKHEVAVLKRVAVPDKSHLASMRTEVETMKKLKGHRHIVTYIDSHASQLKGGGYEVFLLMEYCQGGGLIDFMNTRLQHRLTEPEILKIFGDVSEGVAAMHYLRPPLLHRDLKVENVLISKASSGSSGGGKAGSATPLYKLCDFGSAAAPRPAAKTAEEGRLIEDDVQKHTTMQYRSPEMIDVWRKQPIDEKADIWALGVLLYKLCYYTTPFEDVGQMAILNASYKYPPYPAFSDRIKKFIAWMLKEDPRQRPTIFQVVKEVCGMRGTELPIKDIYAGRTQSEARRNESLPSPDALSSTPVGLQKSAPQVQVQAIPDIAPMRRGRPTATSGQTTKPAASPAKGDPFAALDSKNYDVRAGAVDDLSKRFPSLDEFSIAHEGTGKRFAFSNASSPSMSSEKEPSSINERVTHALADDAFSKSMPKSNTATGDEKPPAKPPRPSQVNPASPSKPINVPATKAKPQASVLQQYTTSRSGSYKSTATGTSPPAIPKKLPEISSRPIWRVPDRAESPRPYENTPMAAALLQPPKHQSTMPDLPRTKSQTAIMNAISASSSSRPSLEGQRPAMHDLGESAELARSRSGESRQRPSSMHVVSDMDYLRESEHSRSKRPSMEMRRHSRQHSYSKDNLSSSAQDESGIDDDMDYLRSAEDSDLARRRSQRKHSSNHGQARGHQKRGSLNALSGATKHMLHGRFGDAFKRFEASESQHKKNDMADSDIALMTPTPRDDNDGPMLSPIAGSEATHSRHSDMDDYDAVVDAEDMDVPLDVRREMERRRLSMEERRVAEAAAEYRARVAGTQGNVGGTAPPTRANTIQQRVQSLLDEGRQSPAPRKTASGYGHYTDVAQEENSSSESVAKASIPTWSGPPISSAPIPTSTPGVTRKVPPNVITQAPTSGPSTSSNLSYPKVRPPPSQQQPQRSPIVKGTPPLSSSSAAAAAGFPPIQPSASAPAQMPAFPKTAPTPTPRPSAPPKPKTLRTGGQWPPTAPDASYESSQSSTSGKSAAAGGGLAALLAKDLEGVPEYPPRGSSMVERTTTKPKPDLAVAAGRGDRGEGMAMANRRPDVDDFEDFSKRYPSLSGIEMVETEIGSSSSSPAADGAAARREVRVREV